jgi:hypothetical protein
LDVISRNACASDRAGRAVSFSYNDEFLTVLGHLAAGRYPTDGWVEHIPFATHTDAYERMRDGTIIKAMVDVQAS